VKRVEFVKRQKRVNEVMDSGPQRSEVLQKTDRAGCTGEHKPTGQSMLASSRAQRRRPLLRSWHVLLPRQLRRLLFPTALALERAPLHILPGEAAPANSRPVPATPRP